MYMLKCIIYKLLCNVHAIEICNVHAIGDEICNVHAIGDEICNVHAIEICNGY